MITQSSVVVINKKCSKRQLHRAGWIAVDPSTIIENGYIEIENGIIIDVHKTPPKEKSIDHGPGVLMPPLVNSHLHLELSALKKQLPFNQGFKAWVKKLLEKREATGEEKLIKAAQRSARDLVSQGILYAGDISTLGITGPLMEDNNLKGICFDEFLGSIYPSMQPGQPVKNDDLSYSLAGHAPHTTAPLLLKTLKKTSSSSGLPFSIHVAESDDEIRFIQDKKGEWADFLIDRGIDWSDWNIGSKTPIDYINEMGLLDHLTIAVHVLRVSAGDLEIIARSGAKVCVCPRSNLNLHDMLPDIEKMLKNGIKPALGTDSLASCESLDVFDEMAFIQDHYPGLDPADIFSMGTLNGARALCLDDVTGTLARGKRAEFLYRSIKISNKKDLFQRIVSNE